MQNQLVKETGLLVLRNNEAQPGIALINIIGEIEGHESLGIHAKATKYEQILPQLAYVEMATDINGVLVLLNTLGGDVEAGLAIAELIASLGKPSVTLVLGGGHSIGVPLAVAGSYSYIVPTATMVVHPIRMNGLVIGATKNYEYIEKMQDRIIDFTVAHSHITKDKLREVMMNTNQLAKDVGSMLVGEEAVALGLLDAVGGIHEAMKRLNELIREA